MNINETMILSPSDDKKKRNVENYNLTESNNQIIVLNYMKKSC